MAQPTGGDLHVSRPLTNISVAYMQGQQDFIADQVFPPVPVEKKADSYYTYAKSAWFKSEAQERAPGTESVGSGWTTGTDNYACRVYAVHKDVADQDRSNQDAPVFDLDRDATEFVTRDLMLKREKLFIAKYFGTSLWGVTDQTGVSGTPSTNQFKQWNDSGATPIEDITKQRTDMAEKTGYKPQTLVIGARVYEKWKNHITFTERIKYTQTGIVTTDLMAATMDLDRILVPMVIENTALEGVADAFSFTFGKAALLVYSAPSPGLMQPSAGYTFTWNGYLGAGAYGNRIKRFRMEHLEADRVEGEMAFDQKMVASDLGVYFTSAVA
jgi:hypothetical protein